MIDIKNYNSIVSGIINNLVYHKNFIPSPTSEDYKNSKIFRYFGQKINTGEIFEISKENFDEISTFFYNKVGLTWYISGPKNDVKQGSVVVKGVISLNRESVNVAEKNMRGIKNYLTDLTQFYK